MAEDINKTPKARLRQRKMTVLNEPWTMIAGITALALLWLLITFLVIHDAMYRWTSFTVAALLLATALLLYLRRNPLGGIQKYHGAIADALLVSDAVPLTVLDSSGYVVELNEASSLMLGYQRFELIGEPLITLIDPGSRTTLKQALEEAAQGSITRNNVHINHRSGFPLELQIICSPMQRDGIIIGSLLICQDLSDRKRNVERIRYMAYYDDMTGLPNRTLFQIKLTESLASAGEEGRLVGVCYLDLDGFKLVNASFGREFGDMLLLQVAERATRGLSEQDLVARMEGDEFAFLFYSISSEEELMEKANKLLKAIEEPYELKGFPVHITASMGLVTSSQALDDGYTMFKKADIALVKAKENGKSDCKLYSESWENSSFERLKLQHELYQAIQRNEFVLHYQPQYDLGGGGIVGVEALVRWNHPVRGLLSPGAFIPLAEESGMIVQIGDWVLMEACRQNKEWQDDGLPPMPVAVNLSIRQFMQHDLAARIAEVLQLTGLEPQYLDLEITESMTIDVGHVTRCLLAITELGVGISVDDFGTGYSSFHYLKNFPIDRLKIDRSFVRDIQQDPDDAEIVAAIIAMAHNLNIQVIAEGVETEEQMEFLRRHQCDEMQGYFRSPPVSHDRIERMLKAG